MSLSSSFSNALSGLNAASRMAEVVSSNVANALTEGYGRRQVELSVRYPFGGVQIDGIARLVDRGIITDRRMSESRMSGQQDMVKSLTRLENLVGATGDDRSLATRVMALETAFVAAAGDPASNARLAQVKDRLSELAGALHDGEAGIRTLREEADRSIADQVKTLNTSLTEVEELNRDIAKGNLSGSDISSLLDRRQMAVDRIAAIVPVREMDRQNGVIALVTSQGATLLDGRAATIGFTQTPTIMPDMTLASGALSGLTLDGSPVLPADGIGKLDRGSLGAAFTLRDETLVNAQAGLDSVARDLLDRFADPATDPTLTPGMAGMLTDAGLPFDPLNETGLAGRIEVNAVVDPAKGGDLSRLRDGLGAVAPGAVGDSTRLNAWVSALAAPRGLSTGGTPASAVVLATGYLASIGAERLSAEENLAFSTARWTGLQQAELAQGVDTDVEMQNLLMIERSYSANARVIETIDSLLRTLMEI